MLRVVRNRTLHLDHAAVHAVLGRRDRRRVGKGQRLVLRIAEVRESHRYFEVVVRSLRVLHRGRLLALAAVHCLLGFVEVLLRGGLVVHLVLSARDPLLELNAAGGHCDSWKSLNLVSEKDLVENVAFSVLLVPL